MVLDYRLRLATLLLMAVGCSDSTEGYRTYNAGDESAATAEAAASAEAAQSSPAAHLAATVETPSVTTAATANATSAVGTTTATSSESPPPVSEAPSLNGARPPRVPSPIRIAMAGVGGNGASLSSLEASTEPREIKLLVPEKDFPRIDSGKTLRVTYDDLDLLKILNMEPVPVDCAEHFPDWLQALDGMQIRIRGFMYPPDRATGLPGFVLARDNQICCFGRDPKVYDIIPVFLKDGMTTDYIPNRPFDVVGRLYIRPDSYRGKIQNLYEIEEAEVVTR